MGEYEPSFKFEKLQIWQKSMDFGEDIFNVSKGFPKDELYNLISQARRAADSIALNESVQLSVSANFTNR